MNGSHGVLERWSDGVMWVMSGYLFFFSPAVYAQTNSNFDVRLSLNMESAEKTVELYEGRSGRPEDVATLRGSMVALATAELLAQKTFGMDHLVQNLTDAKFGQRSEGDVYGMGEARIQALAMRELLDEIKRRNFGRRVVGTVEQLFPVNTEISTSIPVFFVAFGHGNIDAFVRRVVWRGDVPVFVGEGEGELTIVVNLAKAVNYGRNLDERFIGTLAVVAHEVFHATLGVYQDSSAVWQEYFASRQTYLDRLLELTHNEGIAHYLSFEQRSRGYLPQDWDQRINASFDEFNKNASDLLSPRTSPRRAGEIIRASNTSEYWDSYGAITGLFIARQIDITLGRPALAATIALGPMEFYGKYVELTRSNNNLPTLSPAIQKQLVVSP
ncbi:MAG: DUF5700 domain-containing putative Zn-dependent protease [Bacteroidota bacterium]